MSLTLDHLSTDSHLRVVDGAPGPPTTLAAGLTCRLADGRVIEHANLDHGASAPVLATVKCAVDTATRTYASVHRGKGHASQVSSRYYEAAREEVARFVGARRGDMVVFTRHTTDSMSLLASALPAGTLVFVFESEHHATLLPWHRGTTVRLPVPRSVEEAEQSLEAALLARPAEHRLVALTGASNVTGELGRCACSREWHGGTVRGSSWTRPSSRRTGRWTCAGWARTGSRSPVTSCMRRTGPESSQDGATGSTSRTRTSPEAARRRRRRPPG
jgi:hypothetical protein